MLQKQKLLGLSLKKLKDLLNEFSALKEDPLISKHIYQALYRRGCFNFDDMTSISLLKRALLKEHYDIGLGTVNENLKSVDGTRKYLTNFDPSKPKFLVESVMIPQVNQHRSGAATVGTVCVSSQIGCSLNCSFCHTGTKKMMKNLDASEIIAQVVLAMSDNNDFPISKTRPRNITNIVYMGMGEPLLNFRNVSKAVKFVNETFNFSPSRTTISTSGIVPLMKSVGLELGAGLAVSLHAVTDDKRDILVPINKQYPLRSLMDGCSQYLDRLTNRPRAEKRITFEYVMLENVNDSLNEAKDLVRLIAHLPAHVNLIPFNPWPGSIYKSSSMQQIHEFQNVIKAARIPCHIRVSRGQDIFAACGQLASSVDDVKKSANISK